MRISLDVPEPTVRALQYIARAEDATVGQLIRDAIARDLRRRRRAKRAERPDEALIASLRSLLARDLADATGWADLQARLRAAGFTFRPAGGGLILVDLSDHQRVCKASDLGYAHATLARRFNAAFPGHPKASLFTPDAAHPAHLGRSDARPRERNRPFMRKPFDQQDGAIR